MTKDLKWFEDNFCLRDNLTIKKPLTVKGLYGENYEFNVGETISIDKSNISFNCEKCYHIHQT